MPITQSIILNMVRTSLISTSFTNIFAMALTQSIHLRMRGAPRRYALHAIGARASLGRGIAAMEGGDSSDTRLGEFEASLDAGRFVFEADRFGF